MSFAAIIKDRCGFNALARNYKERLSKSAITTILLDGPKNAVQAWNFAVAAGRTGKADVYGLDGLEKANLPHEALAVLVLFLQEARYIRLVLSQDEHVALLEGLTQTIMKLLGQGYTWQGCRRVGRHVVYTDESAAPLAAKVAQELSQHGEVVTTRRASTLLSYIVTNHGRKLDAQKKGQKLDAKVETWLMGAMDRAFEKWQNDPKAAALPEHFDMVYASLSAGLSGRFDLAKVLLDGGYNLGLPLDGGCTEIMLIPASDLL